MDKENLSNADEKPVDLLKQIPIFADLSEDELNRISENISEKEYKKGNIIAIQNKTPMESLLIQKSGKIELYFEENDDKRQRIVNKKGDMYGGLSILMNGGLSIRNVKAIEDSVFYLLPKNIFMDICRKHDKFYKYFAELFGTKMSDKSYAGFVALGQAYQFISDIMPFSFLPEKELEYVVSRLSPVRHPKDTVLFIQGESKIEHLYIIQRGSTERFYEENNQKKLRGVLGEGEVFGGISILLNNSIAVRSMVVNEDTNFYILPKENFLDLCERYPAFSEYFTDTFGKRMLDRSYASIIRKSILPGDETSQFFNQHTDNVCKRKAISCLDNISIQDAAKLMTKHRTSSVYVKNSREKYVGIVTDNDLRVKVLARGYDIKKPVSHIMSSPLHSISGRALVSEALLTMMNKNIKHLAVTDSEEKVVGTITNSDLLMAQCHSPIFLIREISAATCIDEIIDKHNQLPGMIKNLINSGAKAINVTRLITTISDAILKKILDFAIEKAGPAPVNFVFMIMGSEGRGEQTLKTDQDNAIVYQDVSDTMTEEVNEYFLALGDQVCTWLDAAGYDFCEGNVMAKNPKWCQPISVWKNYFNSWIHTANPENLLDASIFFDFRGGYGDMELITQLRDFLFSSLGGWAGFFRHLVENALYFRPPLGFFRNFVVESKGEHRDHFDIKSAMMPIVDFARIYALKNKIEETNTLERLHRLHIMKVLKWDEYNDIEKAYSFLMQLRFMRQVSTIMDEKTKPNNYINPKKLSRIEQTTLKEIFKRIEKFQTKMEFAFTGPF